MIIRNSFRVVPGDWVRVAFGANLGDGIGAIEWAEPEDVYRLTQNTDPARLDLDTRAKDHHIVGALSDVGTPGDRAILEGSLTLISSRDASVVECAVLNLANSSDSVRVLVPSTPIEFGTDYVLTARLAGKDPAATVLSQLTSASFVTGTRLLTGDRTFVPIQDMAAGETLFTRDHGIQVIRAITKQTVRAEGQFAPVTIEKDAFGSHGALTVSPQHRIFVYDRNGQGLGQSPEQLIQARHLLNGVTVTQNKGGFTDYYQVVLDNHEILFAEGIAVESQMPLDVFSSAAQLDTNPEVTNRLMRQDAYARAITTRRGPAIKKQLFDQPDDTAP